MKFRPFSLYCECGLMPSRIRQVGLSADHQLVIHWWCLGCRKAVYVVKDLVQCWEESPTAEELEGADPVHEGERRQKDAQFLHSLGICFPADGEA